MRCTSGPVIFLVLIGVVLLVIKVFVSSDTTILVLIPLFLPIILRVKVSPVRFNIVVVVGLTVKVLAPPFKLGLFITSNVDGVSLTNMAENAVPFVFILVTTLVIVACIPRLSLCLTSFICR